MQLFLWEGEKRGETWEQLAMVLVGSPMDGAHATSRTQSLCASSFCSSFHWPSSSSLTGERVEWGPPPGQKGGKERKGERKREEGRDGRSWREWENSSR